MTEPRDARPGRDRPFVAAVTGPTACGKTAVAVELAARRGGEIVSCDSMQIYRGMDIGTSKPSAAERRGVPHHLLDIADPADPKGYSCADYVRDARLAAEGILARGRLPILCGGTGLYLDAFLRGGVFAPSGSDPALRAELLSYAEREGPEALHRMLRGLDPASADRIHPNNVRRVARAIEICRAAGRPKSDLDAASGTADGPFRCLVIGLRFENRETLYRRIDARAEAMMRAGLPEETRRLRDEGVFARGGTAAQAIGYKELLPFLDGGSEAEAVEALKAATRRYAKRQMTWFRSKPYVRWITADEGGRPRDPAEIADEAERLLDRADRPDGT